MPRITRRFLTALGAAAALARPAIAQRQVTLRIAYPAWDSTDQQRAVTGIFGEYERQNPGVRIEILSLPFPVLRQRLVVAARAGDPPDVAYVDGRWVPEMAVPGLLADITDAAARLDRTDWYAEPWRGASVRGHIFAVPDRVDPWLVYYNTEHFQRAGITGFPDTLDGLAETAKRLTGGGVYGWGLIGAKDASLISRFINFLYAHHGDLLTPDGRRSAFGAPQGVAALRFYTDLLVRHHAAQPSAIANGLNDVNQLFMAGRASMIIDGQWRMGTLREHAPNLRWSVAQLPPAAGLAPRFLTSSWYYALFRGGQHQEETFRFVEFLLRPENMARSVVTLPARRSAAANPRFATPDYAPWLAAAPHAVPFTVTERFTEIADIVGDAVQQVLGGRAEAEAAAAEAHRRIDALIG